MREFFLWEFDPISASAVRRISTRCRLSLLQSTHYIMQRLRQNNEILINYLLKIHIYIKITFVSSFIKLKSLSLISMFYMQNLKGNIWIPIQPIHNTTPDIVSRYLLFPIWQYDIWFWLWSIFLFVMSLHDWHELESSKLANPLGLHIYICKNIVYVLYYNFHYIKEHNYLWIIEYVNIFRI